MKQKVRRISRSTLSVILTLCMIMSCFTVGLVATDAAKVQSDSVGKDWNNYCMIGDAMTWSARSDDYHSMGSTVTYDCSAYIGGNMFFKVMGDDTELGVSDGPPVSIGQWYKLIKNPGASGNTPYRTVTQGLLTFKVTNENTDGQVYVTADADPVYKLYKSDGTAIATFTHSDSSKTFTATSGTLNAGTTYNLYLGNSYTTYKCDSGTLTTGSSVTLEKGKSNTVSFTPSVTAPYIFTWQMSSTLGEYKGSLSVEASTATVTPAVNPSGAGTAEISLTQGSGYQTTAITNITPNSTIYARATANQYYEFAEWETASGLAYTNASQSTEQAVTVYSTATATAKFRKINYNLTAGTFAHGSLTVPAQARWDSTVTPEITPDKGWKVSRTYYKEAGSDTEHEFTDSFTMPKANVTVYAEMIVCPTYTVTFSGANNNQDGIVTAKANGVTLASGASVNEGTVVTFTAVPNTGATVAGWTGTGSASSISGSETTKEVTINAETSVTASFNTMIYELVKYGTNESASQTPASHNTMTMLDSGYYRYGKITKGEFFTISKKLGSSGTRSYAKSDAGGTAWWLSDTYPAITTHEWTSDNTESKTFYDNVGSGETQHYVFYDPETSKIWVSTDPMGDTDVKVFAKDGSLTNGSPATDAGTTSGWGDTTMTVTVNGTQRGREASNSNSGKVVYNEYNGEVEWIKLTKDEVTSPTTTVKVETTVTESGYYVKAFDVNGVTYDATLKSGTSATYEATIKTAEIDANTSNFIEITPIYFINDEHPDDPELTTTIRFYVNSFAGDIKARWGGTLYCYSYSSGGTPNYGDWPGQPMINAGGGVYYIDLPKNTVAITLSNASADWIHATTLGVDLSNNETSWANRNKYQCQSYDYDDFSYIYQKPNVGALNEDIIFDFKYKTGGNNFASVTGNNDTSFPSTLPSGITGWEDYTNYYDELIDLWGTKVMDNNKNANPVHVVVQGYYDTHDANDSYYSTTYVVYDPNGNLVAYTNSDKGYGKKSRSEFLQRTAQEMNLTNLAGIPVKISYEYAIYDKVSTNGGKKGDNQYAERADGVWYYSESRPVKANIQIQYGENKHSAFTDDNFEDDETAVPAVDFDGDPFKKNEGLVTHAKAYFTDTNYGRTGRPTEAPLNMDYNNKIVEWAYSDGNDTYDLTAEESSDGEYTFLGWYKVSGDMIVPLSSSYTVSTEVVTGETFIARYVKTPAGQIKLAHKPVTSGSGGTGERKIWYDIVTTSSDTSLLPSGTTQEANGSLLVPKAYIKYGKGYRLKVKYTVAPDGNSTKNGMYGDDSNSAADLLTEANFESHNGSGGSNPNIQGFNVSPTSESTPPKASLTTDYAEFYIDIANFFKEVSGYPGEYEFNSDFSVLEVFSDFGQKTNTVAISKTVDFVADSDDTFNIKIEKYVVTNPGSTPDGEYQAYTGNYTIDGESGSPTHTIPSTGIVQIHGNETIRLVNVPAGTNYRITEQKLPSGTKYTADGTTPVAIAKEAAADTEGFENATRLSADANIESGYTFDLKSEGTTKVTFKNNIKREDFTVTKIVDQATDPATAFSIHVTLDGNDIPNTYTYTVGGTAHNFSNGYASVTGAVSPGTTMTVNDVPVGAVIAVSEPNPGTGYSFGSISITNGTGGTPNNTATFTVTEGTTHAVQINNIKKHNVTIKKVTNASADYSTTFPVQIQTSTDGTTYTDLTDETLAVVHKEGETGTESGTVAKTPVLNNNNETIARYYPLKKSDKVTVPNLPIGTYVKIIEYPGDWSTYYTCQGISVTNPTASSSSPTTEVSFQIGSADAAAVITNNYIPQTITITKQLFDKNGSVYSDYVHPGTTTRFDDGSTFTFNVNYKPHGSSSQNYSYLTSGKIRLTATGDATAPASGTPEYTNAQIGSYTVRRDGCIVFENIPKGSFVQVNESAIGSSDITGGQRFAPDALVNATNGQAVVYETDPNNSSIKYIPVNGNLDLVQRNIVKKSDVKITKSTDSEDTTVAHTLNVRIWDNGKSGYTYVGSTQHTDTVEYSTINYTRKAGNNETAETTTNNKITIHHGETIILHYPIGSYYEISEDDGTLYQRGSFTVPTTDKVAANPAPVFDTTNGTAAFQTSEGPAEFTYTNNRKTFNFTIKKETNVDNTSDVFKVKVWKKEKSTSNWVQYTGDLTSNKTGDGNNKRTANVSGETTDPHYGEYTITKDEILTLAGCLADSFVRVEESDYNAEKYTPSIAGASGTTLESGATATQAEVKITGAKGVVITNTVNTQSITISKTVTGYNDPNKTFPITVLIEDEKDDTSGHASYSYGQGTSITDGTTATINLHHGESITITGVPVGTTVTVTEGTVPDPFLFSSIDVSNANKDTTASTGQTVKFTTDDKDAAAAVSVVNNRPYKDVTITKYLLNSNAQDNFTINVSLKRNGSTDTAVTQWTYTKGSTTNTNASLTGITIKKGESITLEDIPVGTIVTVTEAALSGYTCQSIVPYNSSSAAITDTNDSASECVFTLPNDNVTVAIENKIDDKTITVKKAIDAGTNTNFPIKVEYQRSNDTSSTWNAYYPGNSQNVFDSDGIAMIASGGNGVSVSIPLDAKIRVTEMVSTTTGDKAMPSGFTFEKMTRTRSSTTSDLTTSGAQYTDAATDSTQNGDIITVNNTQLRTVYFTKTTNVSTDTASEFKITVQKQAPGENSMSYVDSLLDSSDNTVSADGDHKFTIHRGDTLHLANVVKGTQFIVTETDTTASYTFTATGTGVTNVDQISVAGDNPVIDATAQTISFTANTTSDPTVTINNVSVDKPFTIIKNVDVAVPSGGSFKIKLWKKALGALAFVPYASADNFDANGEQRITPGTDISITAQPVGTQFYLEEITNDASNPVGYNYDSVTLSGLTEISSPTLPSGAGSSGKAFTVENANSQTATINNIKKSQLIVTKSIAGDTANKQFPVVIYKYNTTDSAYNIPITGSTTGVTVTNSSDAAQSGRYHDNAFYISNGDKIKVDAVMGDKFKVIENTLSGNDYLGYEFVSYSDGTTTLNTQASGQEITIGDNSVIETITNALKTKTLTISKTADVVHNDEQTFTVQVDYWDVTLNNGAGAYAPFAGGSYSINTTPDSTAGTLDSNGRATLANGQTMTVALKGVPAVAKLKVTEVLPNDTKYKMPTVTVSDGTEVDAIANDNLIEFTSTESQSPAVTIANHIKTANVKVKKVVSSANSGTTTFPIVVSYTTTNGSSTTAHNNETKNLGHNEEATLSNVPVGSTITVSETAPAGYEFSHFTATGSATNITDNPFTYTVSTDGTQEVVCYNVKSAPKEYSYQIKYIFPSRYDHLKGERKNGTQTFTRKGVLSADDPHIDDYFSEGNITEALVLAKQPYETNFYMDMSISSIEIRAIPTGENPVYTATATFTDTAKTFTVHFRFPYEVEAISASGTAGAFKPKEVKPTRNDSWIELDKVINNVGYQSIPTVTVRETVEGEVQDVTYYTEAADTIISGGAEQKFRYWSIKAKNSMGDWVEVAKSGYRLYKYSTFGEYQITPIYGDDTTTANTTTINYLGATRNYWKMADASDTTAKGTRNKNATSENFVSVDFDVSFQYNGMVIKEDDAAKKYKTGVIIEKVGEVEEGHALNDLNKDDFYRADYYHYATTYADPDALSWIETYLNNGNLGGHTLFTNYTIGHDKLTNKNRTELGVSTTVGHTDTIDGEVIWDTLNNTYVKKNALFRAYAYIYDPTTQKVLSLSTPVYYTLKNVAEMD